MSGIRLSFAAVLLCLGLTTCSDQASAPTAGIAARSVGPIAAEKGQWREQDHWIPVEGTNEIILMRLCRPSGADAARLVVVNHGSPPNAAQRPNYAPWACDQRAISWFLTRGYAVALPLRRGYGASGGTWAETYGSCRDPNFVAGGMETARDIRSALAYATAQPGIRRDGAVVVGQSAGGWGSLALAARNPPEVAAIVNMAGGRGGRVDNLPNNNCRADVLATSSGQFGQTAHIPSLWIYTANDSFFSPSLAGAMHQNYVKAGGVAEFRALPAFGQDGHGLFTAAGGPQIWGPLVRDIPRQYPSVTGVVALDQEDVPLEGQIREKLVRTKERWAEEGRLLTGTTADPTRERLPPGQTLVKDWPVLDLGVQPDVSTGKFRLRLEGLVENRLAFDWEGFMALPQSEMVCDIHCVTQWSRYDNRFSGVRTATLLEMARPRPEARFVSMTSYDGYTTNLNLEAFAAADVMVAHSWEGAPLSRQHGGPVRLVLPRLYFWKSPKWLTRIELLAEDRPGFWEVRGYHNQGDPWLEERYG